MKKVHLYVLVFCNLAMSCESRKFKQYDGYANSIKSDCFYGFTQDDKGRFFTEFLIEDLANNQQIHPNHIESAHYYGFNWMENGLLHAVGFIDMETIEDLKLKQTGQHQAVKNLVAQYVKSVYRNQTKEEIERLNEILGGELLETGANGIEKRKNANQKSGSDIYRNEYVEIKEINDYTVYNLKSSKLHTVIGNVHLILTAQVGPYGNVEESLSLELAKKLATKMGTVCL
ncbi:hypothetical protein ACFSKL_21385 [Belliella marina]|uniref:Lipoprotein n=1 Tax=Belliella marina TaxID=1644146 RepID=A0ABW4VWV2_9BACT